MAYDKRKVYWKGLTLVANSLKSYIQRNQLKLEQNLTTPQYQCVVALLDAVITCLGVLPSNDPG
jgi:hypothetical protein